MKLLSLLIIFILFLKVSYIFFELKVLHLKKNGKQDTIEYKNAIYFVRIDVGVTKKTKYIVLP